MSLPNKWGNGELELGSDSHDAKELPGQRVLSLTLEKFRCRETQCSPNDLGTSGLADQGFFKSRRGSRQVDVGLEVNGRC